jgi:GntR family transcriptional regulator
MGNTGYIYDFSYEMQSLGYKSSTQVLSTHFAYGSHDSAEMLKIENGAEIACLERLRFADDTPISIEETYMAHSICPGIFDGHDFSRESVTKVLQDQYGISLVKAKQVVRAIIATPKMASLLGIFNNSPILYVERVAFSNKDLPITYVRIYYRPDRYELQSELPIYQGP